MSVFTERGWEEIAHWCDCGHGYCGVASALTVFITKDGLLLVLSRAKWMPPQTVSLRVYNGPRPAACTA